MKVNGSKIAIVSFSSHVSTLRALGQFDPYRSKEAAKLKFIRKKPLAAIVGTGACSIFVLAKGNLWSPYPIDLLGGLASSVSTSAAANMVGRGQMCPDLAGASVVLASVASALVNLPIIYRNAKNRALSRRLTVLTVVLSGLGIVFLALQELLWPFRK